MALEKDEVADAEYFIALCDKKLEAKSWWGLSEVTPGDAARLLCCFNPDDDANDPELVTISETRPDDFKRLLREFNDVAKVDVKPRTLSQWHSVAHDRGLKHHSWIDKYLAAKELCAAEKPEQGKSEEALPDLPRLRAQEQAILAKLMELCYDPKALPPNRNGKRGVRGECKIELKDSPLFTRPTTFDKAWERLSGFKDIKYRLEQ